MQPGADSSPTSRDNRPPVAPSAQEIESDGRWDAARPPAPPRVEKTPWAVRQPRLAAFTLVATTVAVAAAWQWASVPRSHVAREASMDEVAIIQLRALAWAQPRYAARTGAFAVAGAQLNQAGTLIAADLALACEQWQNNGDPAQPQPKCGYIFRMLQGDSAPGQPASNSNWRLSPDPAQGQRTWAATARAVSPGISGNGQLLITADGVVFWHAEPPEGDPQSNTFLLERLPAWIHADGRVDMSRRVAAGWQRCVQSW